MLNNKAGAFANTGFVYSISTGPEGPEKKF
ncbi:hypothetical protein HNQ91_005659 [Filimonas zeae]|nr:hypothetical protein [Filimonas zeae]